jgi:lysophospholipase
MRRTRRPLRFYAAVALGALAAIGVVVTVVLPPSPVPDRADLRPMAAPEAVRATYASADRYGAVERGGVALRYAVWRARPNQGAAPRGSVIILPGRGEFIEKYAIEVVPELLERGWQVYAIDWRGQGLSGRSLSDAQRGHIDSFDTYVADLEALWREAVAPEAPQPVVALAHSMGGHTLLRWLAERDGAPPIAAAVLAAPMTGLRREDAIRVALTVLPEMPTVDERYFFGFGPFQIIGREFVGNRVTHDERRFRFAEQWFAADPRLTLGGPTIGWLRQAARSIRKMLEPGYLERVRTPTLILSAGQDQLVDRNSHLPAAARLAVAKVVDYEDSMHEIMMERDAIRARFWSDFYSHVDAFAPAPKEFRP